MTYSYESPIIFSKEIMEAHLKGDIHIHNLEYPKKAESIGWNPSQIKGYNTMDNWFKAIAEHINIKQKQYIRQTINDFDSEICNFEKTENLNQEYIQSCLSKFISKINNSSSDHHLSLILNPEHETHRNIVNRTLLEIISKLNELGRFNLTPHYLISSSLEWDNKLIDQVVEWAFMYGTPVFIQKKQQYNDDSNKMASLRNGGFLSDFTTIGRVGSVTINLPRLGFKAKDEEIFYHNLRKITWLARTCLEEKREYLKTSGLKNLEKHYSVISIVGVNETLKNLIDCDISETPGKAVCYKILETLRETIQAIIKETGNNYSLEPYPSMNSSYRLAQLDIQKYPALFTSGKKIPYYTHSSELPSYHGNDLWDALEHQKKIQTLYTGGVNFTVHLKKQIKYYPGCKLLIKRIFDRFGYRGVIINPMFYLCSEHGYMTSNTCKKCGKTTILYKRVSGVIHQIDDWNEGHKEENQQREYFEIKSR